MPANTPGRIPPPRQPRTSGQLPLEQLWLEGLPENARHHTRQTLSRVIRQQLVIQDTRLQLTSPPKTPTSSETAPPKTIPTTPTTTSPSAAEEVTHE